MSVATSGSGFSRRSGSDEGLQEEELAEQVPSATSVVERNARAYHQVAVHLCSAAQAPGQAAGVMRDGHRGPRQVRRPRARGLSVRRACEVLGRDRAGTLPPKQLGRESRRGACVGGLPDPARGLCRLSWSLRLLAAGKGNLYTKCFPVGLLL